MPSASLAPAATYREPFRPQFHFTPPTNWMNDPNGLVYHDGEYHLFYQRNPFGDTWGHMCWGHAVSRDLVHWEHLPVAICEEGDEAIFSGSAVVDQRNTSGFGSRRNPAMVAIYTSARPGRQAQSLAYSTDRGRTWTKYAGNPVLDVGSSDFRDPKVFWHAPERKWVMAVVKAVEHEVALYASPDLKRWTHMSDFGPADPVGGVLECPDLFPLAVDGARKWVLTVNVVPSGSADGAGARYCVGDFDGTTFRADDPTSPTFETIDHGKDFYAAVTWNDAPHGRRIAIGWMNAWAYANQIPTSPWRSALSVPRELTLRTIAGRAQLVSRPVRELRALRAPIATYRLRHATVAGSRTLPVRGRALEIEAVLALRDASRAGLAVRTGHGEETLIGYDAEAGELYVDRTRAGRSSFSRDFAATVERVPLAAQRGRVRLHILVDWSSVEVFGARGERVITDQIFPRPASDGVRLFAEGGSAQVPRLDVWRLRSGWTGELG